MEVSKDLFRRAWGKFATGVTLITTRQEDGSVHGMTANAVCSVALEPPLVLVCIGHQRRTYRYLQATGRFGLNILSEGQRTIAEYYARDPQERTGPSPARFHLTPSGVALVDGALAGMECRVVARHPAGDHDIFVAQVEGIEMAPGRPLLFYERRYLHLPQEAGV